MVSRRYRKRTYNTLRQRRRYVRITTVGGPKAIRAYSNKSISLGKNPHFFKRKTMTKVALTNPVTGFLHYAGDGNVNYWALNNLPNPTEFTYLFDKFSIKGVKLTFNYSFDGANTAGPLATNQLPMLYHVIDTDDSTVLTSRDDYLQYETCKMRRLDKPVSVFFKPRYATAAYNGAFTGYADGGRGWVDCDSSGVQWYGNKWGVEFPTAGAPTACGFLMVTATYYLAFRDVR